MAKTAVMVRLSESELSALDALAAKSGISRATCATSILRQRLNGKPAPIGLTADEAAQGYRTPPKPTAVPKPSDCPHKWRNASGMCLYPGCGDVR